MHRIAAEPLDVLRHRTSAKWRLFDADVLPRIGDVLIAARASVAYYDDRLADKKAQRMVGQHGSLTDQERTVPLVGLGAFARP